MSSFTWGSVDGIDAVVAEAWRGMSLRLGTGYEMCLSPHDLEAVLRSLVAVGDTDGCIADGVHHRWVDGEWTCLDSCWRMRAASLAGSIAESLGVDWV